MNNLNKFNIITSATYIIGFPWETEDDINKTLDSIYINPKLDIYGISQFQLFENTEMYNNPEKYNLSNVIINDNWHPKINFNFEYYKIQKTLKKYEDVYEIKLHKKICNKVMHRIHYMMFDKKYFSLKEFLK